MPNDPYYKTKVWRDLRAYRLRLDGHTCTVPGCRQQASVVDHIKARKDGGADDVANLRSLCSYHDRSLKERPDRKRGRGGRPIVKGCRLDGTPLALDHPWFRR